MRNKSGILNDYHKLLKNNTNYILYGFIHFFFSGLGQTFLIGIFKEHFINSFSLWDGSPMTNNSFSWVYMVCTCTSGTIILLIGPLVDRLKIRHISLVSGVSLIGFTALLSRADGFWSFVIGLFGVRFCGQGLLPIIGSTGVARHFEKDRGKALSLSTAGISISEAILAPLVGVCLGILDWRSVWQLLGFSTLFIFLPLVFFLVKAHDSFQTGPSDRSKKAKSSKGRLQILSKPSFYLLILTYVFPPFFFTGMFVNPNLVESLKGYEAHWLAFCMPAYGISRFIATLIVGPVIDRYSAKKVFPLSMIPLLIGCLILTYTHNPYFAMLFAALAGISMSFSGTSSAAMWAEIYGVKHLGAIKSLTSTLMIFATAASVPIFTWSLTTFSHIEYTLLPCVILIGVLSASSWLVDKQK